MLESLSWLAAVRVDVSNICDEFWLLLMHVVVFTSAQSGPGIQSPSLFQSSHY